MKKSSENCEFHWQFQFFSDLFDFRTHHHPKSTSSNSEHVVASALRPVDDKPRDFHMSIDWMWILYRDIVVATWSMFAWLNAKLMCFKLGLFCSISMICSSAMSTWNKSKRSKLLKRPNGLPVTLEIDAFRRDSSEWVKRIDNE